MNALIFGGACKPGQPASGGLRSNQWRAAWVARKGSAALVDSPGFAASQVMRSTSPSCAGLTPRPGEIRLPTLLLSPQTLAAFLARRCDWARSGAG